VISCGKGRNFWGFSLPENPQVLKTSPAFLPFPPCISHLCLIVPSFESPVAMHDILPTYFAPHEVQALHELQGKVLDRVVYTIWRNVAKPTESYEALEWVELNFTDGSMISLTAGEETTGLQLRELNFGLEQTRVQQQFRGQVELERVEVNGHPVWKEVIGLPITAIGLVMLDRDLYPNHLLQLELGPEMVEFSLGEEGMLVKRREAEAG
jgi:hypothetical protein